jgi:hypothetical protein
VSGLPSVALAKEEGGSEHINSSLLASHFYDTIRNMKKVVFISIFYCNCAVAALPGFVSVPKNFHVKEISICIGDTLPGLSKQANDQLRLLEYKRYLARLNGEEIETERQSETTPSSSRDATKENKRRLAQMLPKPTKKSSAAASVRKAETDEEKNKDSSKDQKPVEQLIVQTKISKFWTEIKSNPDITNKSEKGEIKAAILPVAMFVTFSADYAYQLTDGDDTWVTQGLKQTWIGEKPKNIVDTFPPETKKKLDIIRAYAFDKGLMVCAGYSYVLRQALKEKYPNLEVNFITSPSANHMWLRVYETNIDLDPTMTFFYANKKDVLDEPSLIRAYERRLFDPKDPRHVEPFDDKENPSDADAYLYEGVLDDMRNPDGIWERRRMARYKIFNEGEKK